MSDLISDPPRDPFANYEPKGVRFTEGGREWLLVQEPGYHFDGWLCRRHPDGQWVSMRKATEEDRAKLAAPSVSSSAPPDPKATTIRHQSDPVASSAEPAPPTEFACRKCGQNLAANGACYTCHPIAVPIAVRRQTHALLAKVCELSQEADKDAALQVALVARLRVLLSNHGPAVRAARARGETLETILGGNA